MVEFASHKARMEGRIMVATIRVSPYIFIQGVVTRRLDNGRVAIRVGGAEYEGAPLAAPTPVAAAA
jgi:hypothetical protein